MGRPQPIDPVEEISPGPPLPFPSTGCVPRYKPFLSPTGPRLNRSLRSLFKGLRSSLLPTNAPASLDFRR